jgi:iron(III) transport system ATP-binding protein
VIAALHLEALRKQYPGASRPALDGVDLDVQGGTILVLLGTSGAGKTTLLRIIAGLETADHGRVVLGDQVLSDPDVRVSPERRGVGLVFQHLELWPHMTVAENIAFGLPGRKRGRAAQALPAVQDLAERVGVAGMLDRHPETLSGGERQRVAIARTLAPDPAVLLYDEPLANLDPSRRVELRALIRRLCRDRSTTLVYVTHDAEEAMAMGDEIAVLHAGRVVERGAPSDVYREPSTLAGARALGLVNALPARLENGHAHTVLGTLQVAKPDASRREGIALLRPEDVAPGGEIPARVVDARPRGADWILTAEVDGVSVLCRSDEALAPGDAVGLSVRRPVAVVAAGEGA